MTPKHEYPVHPGGAPVARSAGCRRAAGFTLIFFFLLSTARAASPEKSLAPVRKRVANIYPDVEQWTPEQASEALKQGEDGRPLVFDIRTREEYRVSHLPRARHVPPDTSPETLLRTIPRDRMILVYCSVGYRSSEMARRIRQAGHSRVANLEGSLFAWANEGRPLVNHAGEARRVHGYNRRWSRWLKPDLIFLPDSRE